MFCDFEQNLISLSPEDNSADDETANLKKDDAHFPWGIGGTTQLYIR